MSKRRVVISGMGLVSPNGNNVQQFWNSLVNGESGIGEITAFDTRDFDCKFGGEVRNFNPAKYFKNPKDARRADRFVQFAMAASKEAIESSGIDFAREDSTRLGVIVSSGIGGLKTLEDQHTILLTKGPSRCSPLMIPMMISNMASGMIAIEYNLKGPNFAIVTACASAAHSIGEAYRMIQDGDADVIIAGGSEASIVPLGLAGFSNMKALSLRNNDPQRASRPFDKNRDGFVLSEGAGIVVLEELEHAKKRNGPIHAEIIGYGLSADAHHITAPDPSGEGATRAMVMAIKKAQINPEDINYINAHATSTIPGDVCETMAIKQALGKHAYRIPISSTKSMTGHLLGAAGAVELIACIKTIEEGIIPPTINLEEPDPQCDLDYVPNVAREQKVKIAMNNSFGFGGHNACIIIKRFE
ncbi:beta-ketoacyl-ACP synthase II [Candidatus Methylacidiphilum infernorum]|uniref:3-oxoacyl-[acyl-carrier-protein] synthase 2 n=1 Tax=Candidatus Methylacidiphilum infernorum TaxID=511746 RepID=A0ABX7PUH2_9BACT|nr:beta-ketoacyl-ACP synthase II [Candidatus Methylacidiphilum infernorum]QSR86318.1 beta-ketoacyl-ACP synthase II [Candidatus Methylacidiphilum infernorum]